MVFQFLLAELFIAKIVLHESCCEDYIKVLYFITINAFTHLYYFLLYKVDNIKSLWYFANLQATNIFNIWDAIHLVQKMRFITIGDMKNYNIIKDYEYQNILQSWNKIYVCWMQLHELLIKMDGCCRPCIVTIINEDIRSKKSNE